MKVVYSTCRDIDNSTGVDSFSQYLSKSLPLSEAALCVAMSVPGSIEGKKSRLL